MRLNFLGGVFATVVSFSCALGLLTIPSLTLASPSIVGAPADGASCSSSGCTDYYPLYPQIHAPSNFPGTITINGLLLYPVTPGADVFDDAGLVRSLETGVAAQNPSPGEGLLCIALVLGLGLAARFPGLFV